LRAKSLFMLRNALPADRIIDGYRFLRWMTWIDPDEATPRTFDLVTELHARLPGFVSPERIADQFQEALELWRELGDSRSRCLGLAQFSILQLLRGDTVRMRQLHEQALEEARLIDDPSLIGWALIQACSINPIASLTPEPRRLAEESLALFKKAGEHYGATRAILCLGEIAFGEGRLTEAEAHLADGRERFLKERDVLLIRAAELALGLVARALGDRERAEQYLAGVLSHYEKLDYPDHVGIICANLGTLVGRRGDIGGERQLLIRSLSHYRESHNRPGTALGLCLMGLHHERRGDRFRATQLLLAALEHFPAVAAFLDRAERREYKRIVSDLTDSTTGEITQHPIGAHRLTTDLAVAYAIA
jgi:tetratricopeptide (TPR) repeat protein